MLIPTTGVDDTRHRASFPRAIPRDSSCLGLDSFAQWLAVDQGPFGLAGAVTPAMRARVVP